MYPYCSFFFVILNLQSTFLYRVQVLSQEHFADKMFVNCSFPNLTHGKGFASDGWGCFPSFKKCFTDFVFFSILNLSSVFRH